MSEAIKDDYKDTLNNWFDIESPYLPSREEFVKIIKSTYVDDWQNDHRVGRPTYNKLSWPILHQENVASLSYFIKRYSNNPAILEVCAGTGWLSYWLKQSGLNIIATTDNKSWIKTHNYSNSPTEILKYGAVAAVKAFKDVNIVLLSWPPYKSTMPSRLLNVLQPHQTLIYIGEDNGCTATSNFCLHLQDTDRIDHWDRFWGIHDSVYAITIGRQS